LKEATVCCSRGTSKLIIEMTCSPNINQEYQVIQPISLF